VSESFKKQIVQRIGRNLTDIMILRLIRTQPTWGYNIIKVMETNYEIQLGHGVLYPLLNLLEKSGFIQSKKEKHGGRIRKIYEITQKGTQLLDAYNELLKEQIEMQDIKESAGR
jgi:PadR family transcriptional regulator PadR